MQARNVSKEIVFEPISGYPVLAFCLLLIASSVFGLVQGGRLHEPSFVALSVGGLVLFLLLVGAQLGSIPRASVGKNPGGSVRESNPPETLLPPDRI